MRNIPTAKCCLGSHLARSSFRCSVRSSICPCFKLFCSRAASYFFSACLRFVSFSATNFSNFITLSLVCVKPRVTVLEKTAPPFLFMDSNKFQFTCCCFVSSSDLLCARASTRLLNSCRLSVSCLSTSSNSACFFKTRVFCKVFTPASRTLLENYREIKKKHVSDVIK